MKILGEYLGVENVCGWRDMVRDEEEEKKKINKTRFLVRNYHMSHLFSSIFMFENTQIISF